jgi:type VI secretion system secreted protein VgrG
MATRPAIAAKWEAQTRWGIAKTFDNELDNLTWEADRHGRSGVIEMTPSEIVSFVIDNFEGFTYTDDVVDRGGATKFGITRRTLQYYRRRMTGDPALVVTKADVAALTRDEAIACGVAVFFEEPHFELLPDWRVQLVVYDYGFHSGQARAVKAVQAAAMMPLADQDGVIGPATVQHVAVVDPLLLTVRVLTDREEFMQDLMDRKQTQRRFLLGWWRRTTKLQRVIVS